MVSSHALLRVRELPARERYQLLSSLVVPRPIGWISTRGADGTPNLAPYSYFAALSDSPMQVGVSIGERAGRPKDTLANIRTAGDFCVNVVTVDHLEAMNASSADHAPDVDEFARVGLPLAEASTVEAPYVAECPAVLECRAVREVSLAPAANTLVIGEVIAVRLGADLRFVEGTRFVDAASLGPVGRLWGGAYSLLGEIRVLPRPGGS